MVSQIEDLVNACVNNLARGMPQDPYSFIVQSFEQVLAELFQYASQDIQILGLSAVEVLSSENTPVLSVT